MQNLAIPTSINDIDPCHWETFQPYFETLQQTEISYEERRAWLQKWSDLLSLLSEAINWIYIQKTIDTTNEEAERAFLDYIENVSPQLALADQSLKERLLELDLDDMPDMALVLRKLRNEVDLFREENVPIRTELSKLENEYDKLTGSLSMDWDGEEKNLNQLNALLKDKERVTRERAWRAMMMLWHTRRDELNQLYTDMLELRRQLAENADLPDYRAYAFREQGRFDYTPEDCFTFHEAIETAVVPAARRIYEKKRQQLGLDVLRPWDVTVDTSTAPPLKPFQKQDELVQGSLNILNQVDPALGRYFAIMVEENLLDLETRQGKALGGYCTTLCLRKRPFIFMNGVGIHDDVQTLLHEAGHAFHAFESSRLPLIWQADAPMEFCEVASMSMELVAAPYLTQEFGGFYSPSEAARARIEHLEGIITFLPYMAVVDAFQHWVYTHSHEAANAAACDKAWDDLWLRFMPTVDWTGLEAMRMSGWHRKLHIFTMPFYYIEYGMAQVGALQVWQNAIQDEETAVAQYCNALALGGTRTLPELFTEAGADFRFDTSLLSALVTLIEDTISALETNL
ncbi:MAG: M3 family oligoendopeptidase [Chloroflexi bacterium]|nr:MAG: M3 family oligoendopeptidase [Chloroflexota bacterium]